MNDAKYIGLDVHQATISVVVLDCTCHLVMESIIESKAATILQPLHGLSGSLQVTFEEGTCAAWLHDLLQTHVGKVVVCDPARMPSSKREIRMIASIFASWPTFSGADFSLRSTMVRTVYGL
jgi:hypothetical protein